MGDFVNREVLFRGGLRLQVRRLLGEGGFAFVYLAVDERASEEYVLKRIIISNSVQDKQARNEMRLMERLRHPHIVQFVTSDVTEANGKREAYIVMEHCARGHMFDLLSGMAVAHQSFTEHEALELFRQVVLAVQHLHHQQPVIAHRDLKLENVLLTSTGQVKLCDFGSCVYGPQSCATASERSTQEELIEKNTTQMYRAPEMCDLYPVQVLDEAVDVWALGCILYTMLFLKHPFQNSGTLGIIGGRYEIPASSAYSPSVVELLCRMLKTTVQARANVDEVLEYVSELLADRPIPPRPSHRVKAEEAAAAAEAELQRSRQARQQQQRGRFQKKPPSDTAKKVNPNSAAARRLNYRGLGAAPAAGGGAATTTTATAAAEAPSSPSTADMSFPAADFGDFGGFGNSGAVDAAAAATTTAGGPDAGFASFGDDAGFAAAAVPAAEPGGFNSFDPAPTPASAGGGGDSAFAEFGGGGGGFDAFGTSTAAVDPFAAAPARQSSSGFDAFNSGRGPPSAMDPLPVAPTQGAGGGGDLADLLGSASIVEPGPPAAPTTDLLGTTAPGPAPAAPAARGPTAPPVDLFGEANLLGDAPAATPAPVPTPMVPNPFGATTGAVQPPQPMLGGSLPTPQAAQVQPQAQPHMPMSMPMPVSVMMAGVQQQHHQQQQHWQHQHSQDPFAAVGQPQVMMMGRPPQMQPVGSGFSNFNSGQGQFGAPLQPRGPFDGL